MHTRDDALFWIGSTAVSAPAATIYDVAPTILAALGEEPGAGMDGRSLL
jgi:hypothetical protein